MCQKYITFILMNIVQALAPVMIFILPLERYFECHLHVLHNLLTQKIYALGWSAFISHFLLDLAEMLFSLIHASSDQRNSLAHVMILG